jgi:N-methylhydantoinase A
VVSLSDAPWDEVNELFDAMEAEGAGQIRATGLRGEWRTRRLAEVRYAGQGHELTVEIPAGRLGPDTLEAIERAHAETYAGRYGYAEAPGMPLEATNWKLEITCVVPAIEVGLPTITTVEAADARKSVRPIYVPEGGGFVDCPVYDRYRLGSGASLAGPAVIEERETTVILLPGDRATVDGHGNLLVDVGKDG